jgi:mannosyltransferase
MRLMFRDYNRPIRLLSLTLFMVNRKYLIAPIIVIAAVLRLYDIQGPDIWLDEAYSALLANESWSGILTALKVDSGPPLYYFILHIWVGLFGDSELALRLPSVVGGILLVYCIYHVGARLFSSEVGLLAAGMLAVSPIHIYYSQQARVYSLLALVALVSTYFLWQILWDKKRHLIIPYSVLALSTAYLHYYGLYLLVAHALIVICAGGLRKDLKIWLGCGLFLVVGYGFWVPFFYGQLDNGEAMTWFQYFWNKNGVLGSLHQTMNVYAPGAEKPLYIRLQGLRAFGWVATFALYSLTLLSFYHFFQQRNADEAFRKRFLSVLIFTLVPLGLMLITSVVITPNYIPARADQLVFPGFLLLLCVGLVSLKPAVRYSLFCLLVAFSVTSLHGYYKSSAVNSDRALAQKIAEWATPGDIVLTTSLSRAPLEYYLRRLNAPVEFLSFPASTADHPGYQLDSKLLESSEKLISEARAISAEMKSRLGSGGRFFLVYVDAPVNLSLKNIILQESDSALIESLGSYRQAGLNARISLTLHDFSLP